MLNQEELRSFEQQLLAIAGEKEDLESRNVDFTSALDVTTKTSQLQQKEELGRIFSQYSEDSDQEGAHSETPGEAGVARADADLTEELDIGEYSDFSQMLEDRKQESDVEIVSDDISDYERAEPEAEKRMKRGEVLTRFQLPGDFSSIDIPPFELPGQEAEKAPAEEYETKEESYLADLQELDEISATLVSQDEEGKPKISKVESGYNEDAIDIFFQNLNLYNVSIRNAVIQILQDQKLVPYIQALIELVLDKATTARIQREIESLLNTRIVVPTDAKIYESNEIVETVTSALTKVVQVARPRFRALGYVAMLTVVGFYGYVFGFQYLYAQVHYHLGYRALQNKRYEASEVHFLKAATTWEIAPQYFRYSDLYLSMRNYKHARTKLEQLLFGLDESLQTKVRDAVQSGNIYRSIRINGKDILIKDIVNYQSEGFRRLIDFEIMQREQYQHAQSYAQLWIHQYPRDIDFNIVLGDIYSEWYDRDQKISRLRLADQAYSAAIQYSNQRQDAVVARLRWAVRADDMEYVAQIRDSIVRARRPELLGADVVTPLLETSDYLLLQGNFNLVAELLDIAERFKKNYSPLLYYRGLYSFQIRNYGQALDYFDQARVMYQQNPLQYKDVSQKNIEYQKINASILSGHIRLIQGRNLLLAKQEFLQAQKYIEQTNIEFSEDEQRSLARMYFFLSKLYFEERDLVKSVEYARSAVVHGVTGSEFTYHLGVLSYLEGEWEDASRYFTRVLANLREYDDAYVGVVYATGNAFFNAGQYYQAVAFYKRALTVVDERFGSDDEKSIFLALEDTTQLKKNEFKLQLSNNLGVALARIRTPLSEGDKSFIRLANATKTSQLISRDEKNAQRVGYKTLPELNLGVYFEQELYDGIHSTIYPDIPLTIENVSSWWNISES